MTEIILNLIKYHSGQEDILQNATRFNTLNCGRRFGKTVLGTDLCIQPALDGFPSAWFSPSYKDLSEVWKEVKELIHPIIKSKSEQIKQIELITGGIIDFWSLDDPDSGRGRKYKRIVVDEVAKIKRFKDAWEQSLRPTLTDYAGDAWLLSTPKGKSGYWYKLCQRTDNGWSYHYAPTTKNPLISKKEIEAARLELPPLVYAQEYEAQFVDHNEFPFFHEFDLDRHVINDIVFRDDVEITLSFDFNTNPVSCLVSWMVPGEGCFFYKEYQANGGTSKILQQIEWIRDLNQPIIICGDNSGHSHQSSAEYTDYKILSDFFRQSIHPRTKKANGLHNYSKRVCNHMLFNVPCFFSKKGCPSLIQKMVEASQDENEKLIKDDSPGGNHIIDSFRYNVNAWFKSIDEINRFARICDKIAA